MLTVQRQRTHNLLQLTGPAKAIILVLILFNSSHHIITIVLGGFVEINEGMSLGVSNAKNPYLSLYIPLFSKSSIKVRSFSDNL